MGATFGTVAAMMQPRQASFKKRKLIVEEPSTLFQDCPEAPTEVSSVEKEIRLLSRKKTKTPQDYNNTSTEENTSGQGTIVLDNKRKRVSSAFVEEDSPLQKKGSSLRVEGKNGDERPDGNKTENDEENSSKEALGIGKNKRAFNLTVQNDDDEAIPESGKAGKLPKLSPLEFQIKTKKRSIPEFSRISTGKRRHYTTSTQILSKKRKPTEEYSRTLFAEKDTGRKAISVWESAMKRFRQTFSRKRERSKENTSSSVNEDDTEEMMEPPNKKVSSETVKIIEEEDLADHWKAAMGGNEVDDFTLDYWRARKGYLQKVDDFLKSVAVEEVHASFRKWMHRDPCDAPIRPTPSQVEEENLFSSWSVQITKDSEEPLPK